MNREVIEPKERTFLLIGSLLVVILTMLPNIAGFLIQTPEMRFNGAAFAWSDVATHLVAIRSGMQGDWKFNLFFTPLPQEGHYIKLFYIALGNLFRTSKASPLLIYYSSLAVFNMAVCLVLYRFIAEFISRPIYRATAFLMAVFSSGVGWFLYIADLLPNTDFPPIGLWLIDAYPYFSMVVFPHFSAVIFGQLTFILLFLQYMSRNRVIYLFWMAVIALLLQIIQPYAPLIPFLVIGGVILGRWITTRIFPFKLAAAASIVTIVQIPLLTHMVYVFRNDLVLSAFASQNQTLSPPPVNYLWGFFWFWLLLLPAFFRKKYPLDTKRIGLLVWILGVLILVYLPWPFQRRLILYYTVPLSILSTMVIQDIISPWLDRRIPTLKHRKPSLLLLLLVISGFSHIYLIYGKVSIELAQLDPSYFHAVEIDHALTWLKDQDFQDELMMSTPKTGLLAGVQAHQTVFVAHQFETINYEQRVLQVEQFYCNELQPTSLEPPEIKWIFYGPNEQEICPDFQPPPNFKVVYQTEAVNIYRRE